MNLTVYLSSYFIIIISIIGYGLLFQNILRNIIDVEFEYNLLGSLLFLIFLSFLTHFFFNHGYTHNLIIIIIGIISFIFFYFKKKMLKRYSKYLYIIFGILTIALLTAKTHDDFPYYHFPYTYYLTQENLIIGAGHLVHAFRTPSSIFYLNSLFYLPIIKYFSFNLGAILIFGFSNLILIFKLKNDYKNKRYDFIFFLTLLSFLFINIFFYRIAEHGTDRSAQILILILFIEVFSLYRKSAIIEKLFSKIFILLGLIITLKAFYVLYLLILIPVFIHFKKDNLFLNFFKNFYFYLFCSVGFFLMLINVFNSGCILYPVNITCFSNFEWSLFNEAKSSNDWYEQWAKAGAGPNHRVDDPENYIKGFNWVSNWIDMYFFNKVSDFILGLFILLVIVFLTFHSKKKDNIKIKKQNYIVYSITIILLFEWFYNHPSLRYGGYSLIALILFMPFSIYISKFTSIKYFKEKIIFLIVLSLVIFTGRNVSRIHNEVQKYNYDLFSSPYYYLDKVHFRVDTLVNKILANYQNCIEENKINCERFEGISVSKKNIYYILKR
jgi:hypothetical protein